MPSWREHKTENLPMVEGSVAFHYRDPMYLYIECEWYLRPAFSANVSIQYSQTLWSLSKPLCLQRYPTLSLKAPFFSPKSLYRLPLLTLPDPCGEVIRISHLADKVSRALSQVCEVPLLWALEPDFRSTWCNTVLYPWSWTAFLILVSRAAPQERLSRLHDGCGGWGPRT